MGGARNAAVVDQDVNGKDEKITFDDQDHEIVSLRAGEARSDRVAFPFAFVPNADTGEKDFDLVVLFKDRSQRHTYRTTTQNGYLDVVGEEITSEDQLLAGSERHFLRGEWNRVGVRKQIATSP
jgi:hypothetical protein